MAYDEQDVTKFIELAKEIGISPAMKELNYPLHWVTANKWFEQRGLKPPKSLTQQIASVTKTMYSTSEKLTAGFALLDRINAQLSEETLDSQKLKQLAETYKRTIETIQILEGKATHISQQNDAFDAQYQQLLDDMERKNKELESQGK